MQGHGWLCPKRELFSDQLGGVVETTFLAGRV